MRSEKDESNRLRADSARLRARITELEHQARKAARARKPVTREPQKSRVPFQIPSPLRQPRSEIVLAPLTPPLMLARQMGAAVAKELREMAIETRTLLRALAKGPEAKQETSQSVSAMDDAPADGGTVSGTAQQRLEALQVKYRQRFATLAEQWSRKMIIGVVSQSTAQLSIGLKDMAGRMEIRSTMSEPRLRAVVEASTQSCAQLIKRIPGEFLGEVQIAVMSAITTGSGLDKLVPFLTEKYEGDARHARFVALDQVRKASENVNAARVQALGSEEYAWIHTGGERYPRQLHQSYNGRVFRYDDPPVIDERTGVKGKPGDAIGCRCRQRAIFRFTRAA